MEEREREKAEAVPVPLCCQLIPELGLFQLLRSKGKTLTSGGFGVAIPETEVLPGNSNKKKDVQNDHGSKDCTFEQTEDSRKDSSDGVVEDTHIEDIKTHENKEYVKEESKSVVEAESESTNSNSMVAGSNSLDGTKVKTPPVFDYIFIEDVVFLFERGLLECRDPKSSRMTRSQLYQLLPEMGMSLAVYFVYAHLRSQDFRILRYSPDRLSILRRQQEPSLPKKEIGELKRAVRKTVQNATIPSIPESGLNICWEAYKPKTQFAKTRPGIPDFYVAVTYYNRPHVTFSNIMNLVQQECDGIPLKLATVSDSGVVVMAGVSPDGVPNITPAGGGKQGK